MYQFTEKIDWRQFFLFDKNIVKEKRWAMWTQSARAVYPVIIAHADGKTGESFPSELRIAVLAGRTEKVVRDGIGHLENDKTIQVKPYISSRGHRAYKYVVPMATRPIEKGRWLPWHKAILEGGNWSQLTPTGQALYMTMRCYASYSYADYEEHCDDATEGDFMENYQQRTFDVCSADLSVLTACAGISRRSVDEAVASLQRNALIEQDGQDDEGRYRWKVFLRPPKVYAREWLNDETRRRFAHLLKEDEKPLWKKLPVDTGKNHLEMRRDCPT